MHGKSPKAQPTTEPREKRNEPKRRFQIVKLEERIAPRGPRGPCRGSCAHYAPGHNK